MLDMNMPPVLQLLRQSDLGDGTGEGVLQAIDEWKALKIVEFQGLSLRVADPFRGCDGLGRGRLLMILIDSN